MNEQMRGPDVAEAGKQGVDALAKAPDPEALSSDQAANAAKRLPTESSSIPGFPSSNQKGGNGVLMAQKFPDDPRFQKFREGQQTPDKSQSVAQAPASSQRPMFDRSTQTMGSDVFGGAFGKSNTTDTTAPVVAPEAQPAPEPSRRSGGLTGGGA